MRFSSILAVGAALSAGLVAPVTASPTVMSTIPNHISENVRRELAALPAEDYTIYERDVGPSSSLAKRGAQISGVQTRCTSKSCLSITFDDGPYQWERKLVDTLGDAGGQKGTFFVNGNNFRCIYEDAQVQNLRYTYERGHQICSHTWGHPDISTLNNAQLDQQVQLVEDALWKILGVVPACFRAPYGNIRPDQVKYLNDRWGYVIVGWNEDTGDANGDGVEAGLNLYRNLKMSIRFHKGPSIITLFHDASSPASKQVLQLLTNTTRRTAQAAPSSGSHGESCVVEANGGGVGASEYLRQAAEPPSESAFQLEVVDRKANPPTAHQLRSIIDYLASSAESQQSEGKIEAKRAKPRYTPSGFDLKAHEQRRTALAQHLVDSDAGMPRIKDGPIVVNWDEGSAATSLDGVQHMLARLQQQRQEREPPSSCVVA